MCTKDLLLQIAYLRCTIAPNIREKRKVGNHFETFSDEELRRQILDAIKPSGEMEDDADSIVINAWHDNEDIGLSVENDSIGEVGIWKGSFDRQCVGILVTVDKLQLFRKVTTDYYKLNDLPETKSEWTLQEVISESDYEPCRVPESYFTQIKTLNVISNIVYTLYDLIRLPLSFLFLSNFPIHQGCVCGGGGGGGVSLELTPISFLVVPIVLRVRWRGGLWG